VNAVQASKRIMREPTCLENREGCHRGIQGTHSEEDGSTSERFHGPAGVLAMACRHRKSYATREAPTVMARDHQRDAREGQTRPDGASERFVVAMKPGNSGGAKEPQFKDNARSDTGSGD
jgi:hypothetical protein